MSVVSSSSETGATSPPSYMCMHSVSPARASCTIVFSECMHTLKGMHVHSHYLLLLKGLLKVSFGVQQRVLNEFLKQKYGECSAHFLASYTVCLAEFMHSLRSMHVLPSLCTSSEGPMNTCDGSAVLMRLCTKYMEDASHTHTFVFDGIHLFFTQSLLSSPTLTHLMYECALRAIVTGIPTWPHMMGALCNRPYLEYLRVSSHTAAIFFCTVATDS